MTSSTSIGQLGSLRMSLVIDYRIALMKMQTYCNFRFLLYRGISPLLRSFDNRFEVNWPPEPTLVLRWISKFFLFGALPSDTLKIKHTTNLKEIPSRHALENLPEKACMNAFIHLKLISNVQGFN